MSNKNLCIDIHPSKDKNGNVFYVGKLQFPGSITLKDGATFLVFLSDKGCEQIQIACMDKNDRDD